MIGCNYLNNFYGFSFHISGSANKLASKVNVDLAHKFIKALVIDILKHYGNLIVTFGVELKEEDSPLIFDYTILEAIHEFFDLGLKEIKPNIQALLYNDFEKKMPNDRKELFNNLKNNDCFQIKVLPYLVSHGGNLRKEISKHADILFILGGLKGVHDLVKKFQEKGKAIIPLNINFGNLATNKYIEALNNGSLKLYSNSISSRVISEINKFHLTSQLEIKESKKKIIDLIPLLIKGRIDVILKQLLDAIISLQEKNRAVKPEEDKYSIILVEFLRRNLKYYGYSAHSQEISGKTKLGYDDKKIHGGMGELDIRIVDENNMIKHICEAFILTHLNSSYIASHLDKLFDYDLNGLPINFIIVYSKADDFSSLWSDYLDFLKNFEWKYALSKNNADDLTKWYSLPAEIKLSLTEHKREGIMCKLYHLFINLK